MAYLTHVLSPALPALLDRAQSNPRARALIGWLGPLAGKYDFEPLWLLFWRVPVPGHSTPPPRSEPAYHYFPDMDVLHWRSAWNDRNATALAFKAGPPGGHRENELLPTLPEWHTNVGHAHPDAGTYG